MYNNFRFRAAFWFCIICAIIISTISFTKAGTILLMGVGLGTPGSGPPPACAANLDFSDGCNSAYVTLL